MLIIDVLSNSTCVTIEAVDDDIAEDTESFNLTAMSTNTLDVVNDTTDIDITDNDGILACQLLIVADKMLGFLSHNYFCRCYNQYHWSCFEHN